MSGPQRWEQKYVTRERARQIIEGRTGQNHPELAAGSSEPIPVADEPVVEPRALPSGTATAIAAAPHRAAAPNPGEYTNRLPVGEYTERLPVGEHTQLLREPVSEAGFKAAGLMGGDLPDPPMFLQVKEAEKFDPAADAPVDGKPESLLAGFDEGVAALLAGYDQDRLQLFAESAARWRVEYRQVTAS